MEIEQEAAALGWMPKEVFRGNPDKWTDAATFVQRGKDIMPILRQNNAKLLDQVNGLGQQLQTVRQQLADTAGALAEFKEYQTKTAERAYEKAVKELKERKIDALEAGNHREVVEIDDGLRELEADRKPVVKAPVAAPAPAPAPATDPVYASWAAEVGIDSWPREEQAAATGAASYLRAMGNKDTGRVFLDAVYAEVKKKVTPATRTSKVDPGGGLPSPRGGKSYANLPADAKQACDRYAEKLVGTGKAYKTVDEWRANYVSQYAWD